MSQSRSKAGSSRIGALRSRELGCVLCISLLLILGGGLGAAVGLPRPRPVSSAPAGLELAGGTAAYSGAEGEWADIFGKPGVNGPVYGLGRYEDVLLVGGEFDRAGHIEAKYIAGWDGASWIALGDPDWGPDQDVDEVSVHAFAIYGSLLIAGGRMAGGNVCDLVAAWDGASWSEIGELGDPVISTVNALCIYEGSLVAGGFIPPKRYVASYEGGIWTTLGDGMNGEVLAMTAFDDDLVAAGRFTEADEKTANHIARWNGTSWAAMGGGLSGNVYALAVYGECLVAAGDFPGFIAVWNGATWDTAGGEIPGVVRSLGLCSTDADSMLYGGGGEGSSGFIVRNRSGSLLEWDIVTAEASSAVHTIGATPGDSVLYVGGAFTSIDTVEAFHVAVLEGHRFSHLGQAGNGLDSDVEVLGVYGNDLVAATWPPSVLSWNGTSWQVLAEHANDHIETMLEHNGYLVVGGEFTQLAGQTMSHIAQWNGTSWSQLGAGVNGDVYDFAEHDGCLVAGGSFSQSGGVTLRNLAVWDGSSWSELGGGRGHPVDQVTVWNDKVVVSVRNTIQSWNGISWRLLGTTYGTVRCLEAYGPVLVVAGDFYEIGGVSAARIATWDGDSWSPMGSGLHGDTGGVFDVAIYNGNPVAAGFFESPCYNIARWDGFSWQCLGGLDDRADALTVWNGGLVTGGTFKVAGDMSSYGIAIWDDFVDPVDSLAAKGLDEAISISWRNPADQAYRGVLIRYSLEGFLEAPDEGLAVPNGNDGRFDGSPGADSSFLHAGLPSDVAHYYGAFAYDDLGRFSSGAFVSATTLDKNPPDTVSHFAVTAGVDFLQIRWTNPVNADFRGTLIRYSPAGYPAHPDSGEPVPNGNQGRFEGDPGSQGSFVHSGVEVARTYFYSAFAYDEELNHAPPVRARGLVPDTFPPELELFVFQNPYLTQYLDVYLLSSEPADSASVYMMVGAEYLDFVPVREERDVWLGQHELSGPGGTLLIVGCADDTTGNANCAADTFSTGLISRDMGGLLESPDGRLRLYVPPGSLAEDAYLTASTYRQAGRATGIDPAVVGGDLAQPPIRSDRGKAGIFYRLTPRGVLGDSKAHLEITYGDPADYPAIQPDRYYIEQAGEGPLETYVDPETGTVSAEVSALGVFRVAVGEPGSSRMADPEFLYIAPCLPNPCRGETTITFRIAAPQHVRVAVYDALGRLVERVISRHAGPGTHRIRWSAGADRELPSGIYFIRVSTDHGQRTVKLVLAR